jgi:hypothetical protein
LVDGENHPEASLRFFKDSPQLYNGIKAFRSVQRCEYDLWYKGSIQVLQPVAA